MTNITKTSQSVAFNTNSPSQNSVFDAAKAEAKIQLARQLPQAPKIRLVRPSAPPSVPVRSIIIKTNGRLNSFEVKASGNKLLIRTPQGVPIGEIPNTPSINQFLKAGGAAAALGAGEVSPFAGAGTAGGIFTVGALVTAGLFLLAGGITYFAGMGSAGSKQEDQALKQLKKKEAKPQKPQAQQGINPQLKPPAPLIGANPDQPPSFIPATKQRKFAPHSAPSSTRSPAGHIPVPVVPKIPTIRAVPVLPVAPLPVLFMPKNIALPKGGGLKTPVVKGVKLTPLAPNYVGARRDVKVNTQSSKTPDQVIRNSVVKDKSETQSQSSQNMSMDMLKSSNPNLRRGAAFSDYWKVYDNWLEKTSVNPANIPANADPLNPSATKVAGFYTKNNTTFYLNPNGRSYDASIFDAFLENGYAKERQAKLDIELRTFEQQKIEKRKSDKINQQRKRRANETPEQKADRLKKDNARLANRTEEQKLKTKQKTAERFSAETLEQKKDRIKKMSDRRSDRLANETAAKKKKRLKKENDRLLNQSEDKKANKRQWDKDYQAARRAAKKLDQ